MTLDAVYVVYWSFRDPLCQSQSLPVLRALAREGWRIALVTFEQPAWALPPAEERQARAALRPDGIEWIPLRYHKRPRGLATVFDILAGVWRCVRLTRTAGVRLIHGRATVPAAIACVASRLTGTRFFNDADGPLSEEYVDAGLWSRGSLWHRLAGWAERRSLEAADAVAVLSEHRRREVEGRARSRVTVLPCGVDTTRFAYDAAARERIRKDLGLSGTVLVYAGKSGGWYRTEAMMDFAKVAQEVLGPLWLLVLTTEEPERFAVPASRRGLRFRILEATREEMPAYLSAGDAGLSLRLDTPSQRACSPIKNGEYLSCGLPIVTTAGAGDYGELVVRRRVGVALDTVDEAGFRKAGAELRELLADPGLRARCRDVAARDVGLSEVVVPLYLGLYRGLLGPAFRPPRFPDTLASTGDRGVR